LPDFRFASVHSRQMLENNYVVTVAVENRGDAGAEIPVVLKLEQGQITQRLLVQGKSTATIRMEAASTPREVVLNDGSVPESDTGNNVYKIERPEKGS